MKLIALAVILTCCLVHVNTDCDADQAAIVQQQWQATFGSDSGRLHQLGRTIFERSAAVS